MKADLAQLFAELEERRKPVYGDVEALTAPRFQTIRRTMDIGIDGNREGARQDAAKKASETREAREPSLFKGYRISKTMPQYHLFGVSKEDGSPVCEELAGWFTSKYEAKRAILQYGLREIEYKGFTVREVDAVWKIFRDDPPVPEELSGDFPHRDQACRKIDRYFFDRNAKLGVSNEDGHPL